jgi:membrane protein implicated in regulation of membrane protease activity
MILIGGILLAIFLLPEQWRLPVILVAAAVEVAETVFWLRYSRRGRVQMGPETLVGATGRVVLPCAPLGQVRVQGELWRAHCAEGAAVGEEVRVVGLDGLTLTVERAAYTPPMIVREALVADPRVLQADAPAQEVAAVLAKPHVENVLVTDGDRLVGSVGEESIVTAVAEGRDLRELTARDLADPDVPTVGPDTPLDEALVLMGESDLERVAVVEDGRLLGILPREPVVRRLAEDEPPPPDSDQQQV